MLVLLLLYSLILFVLAYPLLPVSLVGVIAFGGSALLATWTYLWGYRWLYHQPAPQKPCALLALPLEPLRRYLKLPPLRNPCCGYLYIPRKEQSSTRLRMARGVGRSVATQLEQASRGGAEYAHRGLKYMVVSPHRRGADTDCRGAFLPRGTHGVDDAETLPTLECHPPSRTPLCHNAPQPCRHTADLLSCAPAGLPALGYRLTLGIGRATHV